MVLLSLRGYKLKIATGFRILVIQMTEKELQHYVGLAAPQCEETDRAGRLRMEPESIFLNDRVSRESSGEAVRAGCGGASSTI